ncbi:MAG: uncharacterized protein PWP48_1775 [Clostridiales bacterium]|jgi:hypothetical protein|nr:uncharacterized protein [Clostridiales bacterium]MDK2992542.1 uncharacterized protein [Clostridiales bacterium]
MALSTIKRRIGSADPSCNVMRESIIDISKYDIVDDNIPYGFEGYTILQISDLHNELFGENQCELVNRIKSAKPDVIFITGDIIYKKTGEGGNALLLIRQVTDFVPVYFVSGNHDWESGCYDELSAHMRECGVKILDNRFEKVSRGDEHIYILGVDDRQRYAKGSRDKGYEDFKKSVAELMAEMPKEGYKIMLCHRPEMFPLLSSYDIDLVFAGHAHGGQVRLPHIPGLFAPGQGLLPKYTAGIYEESGSRMVVSRGLGNNTIMPRINNDPEIVTVKLM